MSGHDGHRKPGKPTKTSGLVALSTAAVLTVYSAGYLRTRAAAEGFESDDARRPVVPAPAPGANPSAITSRPPAPPERAPALSKAATPDLKADAPPARLHDSPPPSAPAPAAKPAVATTSIGEVVSSTPASAASASPSAPASSATAGDTKSAEPAAPAPAPQPQYKDGTFFGWGTSRHGDIQAYVVIEGGHITVAAISQCLTRYSCSWIAHLPGQVIVRQNADVDYVTGATQSTNAFYYAIVEALSKAK
jgi:uncharacterized protein with FMN-binding domain